MKEGQERQSHSSNLKTHTVANLVNYKRKLIRIIAINCSSFNKISIEIMIKGRIYSRRVESGWPDSGTEPCFNQIFRWIEDLMQLESRLVRIILIVILLKTLEI